MKAEALQPAVPRFWQRLLWGLVMPRSRLSVQPTMVGTVLVALSLGLGVAAYNSANNILFITLSMLLACLIFSGVLSWFNMSRVSWEIRAEPPWRAGQDGVVYLLLSNAKRLFPTYGLWFDIRLSPLVGPAVLREEKQEGTVDRRSVRERLAAAERSIRSGRVQLEGRLDPDEETRLEWNFVPVSRGRWRWELASVGTSFPFGFLRKQHVVGLERELCVWPATIAYAMEAAGGGWSAVSGDNSTRGGSGIDLLSLRAYAPGDSHRLIHWKASARQRQLLVRQHAAEQQDGFILCLDPSRERWLREAQFERAVSFAATLAEDLFKAGRLKAVMIGTEPPTPVRRVADLENWLDRLAVVTLGETSSLGRAFSVSARSKLHLAPDGTLGVAAYLDGRKAATA